MSKKDCFDANLHRKKDNAHKYKEIEHRDTRQYYVAQDVKRKQNSYKHGYNSPLDKEKGKQWFNEGMKLTDAPIEMQNNVSFVSGYNMAYRKNYINNQLYELGRVYYDRGVSVALVPDIYQNNEYFLRGYNDANNNCKER